MAIHLSSNVIEVITTVVYGTLATIIGVVTIHQGRKAWQMWYRSSHMHASHSSDVELALSPRSLPRTMARNSTNEHSFPILSNLHKEGRTTTNARINAPADLPTEDLTNPVHVVQNIPSATPEPLKNVMDETSPAPGSTETSNIPSPTSATAESGADALIKPDCESSCSEKATSRD